MNPKPLFQLRVDGVPKAQGRPRFSVVGYGYRNVVRARDPERSRAWKNRVAHMALTKRPIPILTCALQAEFRFDLPRPKTRRDAKHHTQKPDVDNLAKAVKDALSGVVYADDCQIVTLRASKRYSEDPGVWIWLHGVED